jgi:hypothetical protein
MSKENIQQEPLLDINASQLAAHLVTTLHGISTTPRSTFTLLDMCCRHVPARSLSKPSEVFAGSHKLGAVLGPSHIIILGLALQDDGNHKRRHEPQESLIAGS